MFSNYEEKIRNQRLVIYTESYITHQELFQNDKFSLK
jgi:hypothetical protein